MRSSESVKAALVHSVSTASTEDEQGVRREVTVDHRVFSDRMRARK